jgi:hypothetical protein
VAAALQQITGCPVLVLELFEGPPCGAQLRSNITLDITRMIDVDRIGASGKRLAQPCGGCLLTGGNRLVVHFLLAFEIHDELTGAVEGRLQLVHSLLRFDPENVRLAQHGTRIAGFARRLCHRFAFGLLGSYYRGVLDGRAIAAGLFLGRSEISQRRLARVEVSAALKRPPNDAFYACPRLTAPCLERVLSLSHGQPLPPERPVRLAPGAAGARSPGWTGLGRVRPFCASCGFLAPGSGAIKRAAARRCCGLPCRPVGR